MFKTEGEAKTGTGNETTKSESAERERFKRQIAFALEVDKLKNVDRRTTLLDVSRQENSAEHSWHIALLVLVLSEYANDEHLDLFRVLKMLLIHDLVEIDAGDTYCYDATGGQDQEMRETKAAKRLFNILPSDQADAFRSLWNEYEAKDSSESKFANALDRVQPFLHNYFTRGHTWQKHSTKKKQVVKRMQPVDEGSRFLWKYVSFLIDDAAEKGYLSE